MNCRCDCYLPSDPRARNLVQGPHPLYVGGVNEVSLAEISPAQYLRVRRRALGLSQNELAERVGTSRSVIAAFENEQRTLTSTMESKVRSALEEDPSVLLRRHRQDVLAASANLGFTNVRVFGSVARGDAQADSDIDLFVDYADPESGDVFDLFRLADRLENILAVPVDVKLVPPYLDRAPHAAEAVKSAVVL